MLANGMKNHQRNPHIRCGIWAPIGLYLDCPTLGSVTDGICTLRKWRWAIGKKEHTMIAHLCRGVCILAWRHRCMPITYTFQPRKMWFGQASLPNDNESARRYWLWTAALVMDYCIGQYLCTSLSRCRVKTRRISRGLCASLNVNWACSYCTTHGLHILDSWHCLFDARITRSMHSAKSTYTMDCLHQLCSFTSLS